MSSLSKRYNDFRINSKVSLDRNKIRNVQVSRFSILKEHLSSLRSKERIEVIRNVYSWSLSGRFLILDIQYWDIRAFLGSLGSRLSFPVPRIAPRIPQKPRNEEKYPITKKPPGIAYIRKKINYCCNDSNEILI